MLPLQNLLAVKELERKLKESARFTEAITSHLHLINGTSQDISSVMRSIFSDDLLEKYNWDGRWDKQALSKLFLVNNSPRELLHANGESISKPLSVCINSYNIMAYKLSISTRYYKTEVLLFECNELTSIPHAVKNKIEGSIFYFDSNSLNFLSDVKTIVKFVHDNNIEVSALITRNIFEKNLPGVSHDEVQSMCKVYVNVVDLNDTGDCAGFTEVIELLKNNVWSSVNISSCNANNILKLTNNDVNVEEALTDFEELINMFQQFKNVSQTMRREEVLKNAENLAELFENMLNQD